MTPNELYLVLKLANQWGLIETRHDVSKICSTNVLIARNILRHLKDFPSSTAYEISIMLEIDVRLVKVYLRMMDKLGLVYTDENKDKYVAN